MQVQQSPCVDLPCAWCHPPTEDTPPETSHGVCIPHRDAILVQSAQRQFDKVPSYVGNRRSFEEYKEKRRAKR